MTSHKTQGETLSQGIIDLGKSERSLGSTFVQFSRFKNIKDFLVIPFPFSRLTKIGLSKSLAPRILEEKRLDTLNQNTKINFKEHFLIIIEFLLYLKIIVFENFVLKKNFV